MQSVCVYCASSTQINEKYFCAAAELGTLIAQRGLRLITGAGRLGLMNTVQDATLAAGGEAIGVIPTFMVKEGWHHTGLTQLIETASMHERKQTMANLSDGVIALPGGCDNFMRAIHADIWKVATTPAEAVELLMTTPVWDMSIRKFAAI